MNVFQRLISVYFCNSRHYKDTLEKSLLCFVCFSLGNKTIVIFQIVMFLCLNIVFNNVK